MNRVRLVLATLATLAVFATPAGACSCIYSVPGFVTAASVTLPSNAIGVPWAGSAMDSLHQFVTPNPGHFRIEFEEKGHWRSIPAVVVPVPDDSSGVSELRGDPPIILVGPKGGFRPGVRYRLWSLIAEGKRKRVEVVVSKQPFLVADHKASAVVGPVTRGATSALTLGGSCSTYFHATSSSIRLVLPKELEPWADALLYVVRNEQGEVWRPDSSLCNRTLPGRNALGLGHERLFVHCGPPREGPRVNEPGTMRSDTVPPEQRLPEGTRTLEFVAWLPGTKERIAASARVVLDCEGAGQ